MKKRGWSIAVLFPVLASLQVPVAAQLQVVKTAAYEGVAPLSIAVDGAGRIYVPDLYAGIAYVFDASLSPIGTIPSPGGFHLHTAIAWNPGNDHLYWADSTTSQLHETTLEGASAESHPLPTPEPGGIVAAMTFDSRSGTFLCLDSINDEVFELTPEGVLAGGPAMPMPTGAGSYGLGIAWIPEEGWPRYDLLCGSAEEGRVSRLVRMSPEGAIPCSRRDAGVLGEFLGGIARKPGGEEAFYVVDNGSLAILEVKIPGSAEVCPPAGLACLAGTRSVELRWNPGAYTALEIWRDHQVLQTLGGGEGSFVDWASPAGASVLYEVIGLSGDLRSYPAACSVEVPQAVPPALPLSDSFGYRMEDAGDLSFDDIAAAETKLTMIQGDDGDAAAAIGFSFPFYGSSYDTVRIGANGFLRFAGPAVEPANTTIPSLQAPNGVIAPLWDDLVVSEPGGSVNIKLRGVAPQRTFTVQWTHAQFHPADPAEPNGDLNFQAVLHESGRIEIIWGRLRAPESDLACGASATVGIESPDGAGGILYAYRRCAVREGSAVRILPPGAVEARFLRGDANADGSLDISDPIAVLLYAFAGGTSVPCLEAADSDDSDEIDVTDAILLLEFLFLNGPPPAEPFADPLDPGACATDPTPPPEHPLGCNSFGPCETGARR